MLLGREKMTAARGSGSSLAAGGRLRAPEHSPFRLQAASAGQSPASGQRSSYSFYLVLSRPILARYSVTFTVVSRVFLFGALPILAVASPFVVAFRPARVTPLSWLSLSAVILVCTVLPYLLNSWALARTHASRVAFYVFVQPVIASALAVSVLGETLNARTVSAAVLIFAGLATTLARGARLPARPLP